MKINIICFFAAALVLFVFSGCAPQLARTKYGNVENQWKDYIQKSYKDWDPPPTPPPLNNLSTTQGAETLNIGLVPEPVMSSDLALPHDNSDIGTITLPEITSVNDDSAKTDSILPPDAVTYTVEKGDTLWSISCKFYNNDGTKWKKIQEANKDVLTSPGKIKPGLILTIPK